MCTVRWWAVLAFGAALSAGVWGGETTGGDPQPGTEAPGDPPSCTYSKLSEAEATGKPTFEPPEAGDLVKTSKACAAEADKAFDDVREAVSLPYGDGVAYGFFHWPVFPAPVDEKILPVLAPTKKLDGVATCPKCGKKTLYSFEGYPGFNIKKEDWGKKLQIEMAYWTEYRENQNTAINPEARIGWETHYAAVLAHENAHKKDYEECLKAIVKALDKYASKKIHLDLCVEDEKKATNSGRDAVREEIKKKIRHFARRSRRCRESLRKGRRRIG